MRVFKEPNLSNGWYCPVCKMATEKEVTLVGIAGTAKDGIEEAEQFHLDCLDLVYHPDKEVVGCSWA